MNQKLIELFEARLKLKGKSKPFVLKNEEIEHLIELLKQDEEG